MPNPTVGDVIGGRKTIVKEYPMLPSALPNAVKVAGSRYDKLPSQLQQTISWAFGKDIMGDLIAPVSLPFAKVNNRKITLSFKPATAADEQALLSLLPEGEITDLSQLPTTIPSYLVDVVPELKLEGQVVKTGSAMPLGQELDFVTATRFAGRGLIQSPRTYKVIAGSYLAVNAYAGSVSPQSLKDAQTRLEHTKTVLESADPTPIGALTRQELLGDLFHADGLGYYAQLTALNYMLGLQANAHHTLAAGTGTFGYEPKVDYFFGFPRATKAGGVAFDIPLVNVHGMNNGDKTLQKQFVQQTGVVSSALEHAVPEQMFVNAQNPGEAISAVKALQKANAQGQRIYRITQANQAAILGNIHHDADTMDEIRNALNAGKEVITHTDAVSVPGWSGAGYIITDPDTGVGAYKIAGGRNGGFVYSSPSESSLHGCMLDSASYNNPPPVSAFLMLSFSQAAMESPALLARIAEEAGIIAGLSVMGVTVAILLVVTIYDMVNTINKIQEEFKDDVIKWAASGAVASQWPNDNCKLNAYSKIAPEGWVKCGYSCKAATPSYSTVVRYLPIEFSCPTPLPCVPGIGPEIPAPRKPYGEVPLNIFECKYS